MGHFTGVKQKVLNSLLLLVGLRPSVIETRFLVITKKKSRKTKGHKRTLTNIILEFVSRTRWWLTHRGWGSRHGITAASKRTRCWSSLSWRVTRTSQANPHPNHDGRKTKPRATPDLSASEWRRTSWSTGQSHFHVFYSKTRRMTMLTTGFITKMTNNLSIESVNEKGYCFLSQTLVHCLTYQHL